VLLRFRREYSGVPAGGPALVVVLGEVAAGCCVALQAYLVRTRKICTQPGFLNRSTSK
jgi:hypothetical protein